MKWYLVVFSLRLQKCGLLILLCSLLLKMPSIGAVVTGKNKIGSSIGLACFGQATSAHAALYQGGFFIARASILFLFVRVIARALAIAHMSCQGLKSIF